MTQYKFRAHRTGTKRERKPITVKSDDLWGKIEMFRTVKFVKARKNMGSEGDMKMLGFQIN
jgi:hypothetical protein